MSHVPVIELRSKSFPVSGRLALATTLVIAASAAAADALPPPPTPEVVVTATRVPTPLDEVLAPVVVIDRATIERSNAGDTADLLRFHAGLEIARNGGPGQPTSLFIRGAESNHTLVLVDGVRINPGTIGLPALQNIAPDMIERIEVVKGPRSTLWGSDAIGGVVNIITRRGARDGWVVEAGYGDYETKRASASGGVALGERADLDVGVSWTDSAGFPTRTFDDTDRGYDNLSANVALRADLGPAEVTLQHWRAEGTSEYSDFFLTPVDQDFLTSSTAASVRLPVGENGEARIALSHLEDEIDQNQSPDFLETRRDTLDAQYDWKLSDVHAPGVGVMYTREDASSESYGEGFDADTDAVNVYVQDRITAGPHLALLALGYTDHDTAGSAVTWNAEYGYTFNAQRTRVFALAGSGFRAPDASDRYGFGGNPDLEPEQSDNYEIGVRHALGDTAVAQSVGLPHRDRRPDRLHDPVVRPVRRREPQRRACPDPRHRGRLELHRHGLAGARGGDLPGAARPGGRLAAVASRGGKPHRGRDPRARAGAAGARRAGRGRTQGLRLSRRRSRSTVTCWRT